MQSQNLDGLERFVISYVGDDWFSPSFPELAAPFQRLTSNSKKSLMDRCQIALSAARDEDDVFVGAYVLVALYPDSLRLIEEFLSNRSQARIWDIHFQFFFVFSSLGDLPRRLQAGIEKLIETYLLSIDRESGHAAWMAAHCLGDHWDPRRALPVLERVCRNARYVAGRSAALFGLKDLAMRTRSPNRLNHILQILDEIATTDRSREVRSTAVLVRELIIDWRKKKGDN